MTDVFTYGEPQSNLILHAVRPAFPCDIKKLVIKEIVPNTDTEGAAPSEKYILCVQCTKTGTWACAMQRVMQLRLLFTQIKTK
jgi:hypothetical protein